MASKSKRNEFESDEEATQVDTLKIIGVKRPPSLVDSLSIDYPSSNTSNKRQKIALDTKWKVHDVPVLPCLYTKERTSITLLDANVETVCQKIVDSAKALSVYGQYYDEKAKAILGKNGMELTIQIFKDSSESDKCFIVEARRKNGSSILFHRVARNILAAIKSIHQPTQFEKSGTEILYSCTLPSKPKYAVDQNDNDKFASRMDVIGSLLNNDRFDASLLAIQSLELLTNTRTASEDMVSFVANIILSKEHEYGNIKDKVLSLIRNEEEAESGMEESYLQKKRIGAFSILSNSLASISREGQREYESDINLDEWITGYDDDGPCLLPFLLEELKNAQISPEGAFHAAACLKILFEKSMIIKRKAIDLDVTDAVLSSQKVGHCAHLMLGSISDNLVRILGEAK